MPDRPRTMHYRDRSRVAESDKRSRQGVRSEFLADGAVHRVRPTPAYQYDEEKCCPHYCEFCAAPLSTEKPAVRYLHFKCDEQQFDQKQQRKRTSEKADRDADGPDRF